MTTPPPHTVCPDCGMPTAPHPDFGIYCKTACLTAAMRGEIMEPEPKPHFADRSQRHAS